MKFGVTFLYLSSVHAQTIPAIYQIYIFIFSNYFIKLKKKVIHVYIYLIQNDCTDFFSILICMLLYIIEICWRPFRCICMCYCHKIVQ